MDDKEPFTQIIPAPTAARPLLGLTVLVVEDSRFACEALRLLCLRSGARIRRADCVRAARRHLQVYRPSAVIIDLGLPDGDGVDLIAELHHATPRVDALMATSGDDFRAADALAAGADGFMSKPLTSLAAFQNSLLSVLPAERRPTGPRAVIDEMVFPDLLAYRDDMAHIADFLEDQRDAQALDYVAQFVRGVARSADDPKLEEAALALATKRAMGESAGSETAILAGMLQSRLSQKVAI